MKVNNEVRLHDDETYDEVTRYDEVRLHKEDT
jgi:hypothetical protein